MMYSDESKIFQLYVEAYNEATVQKLIQKFQQEQPGLSEDSINFYIKRFDEIKTSPKLITLAAKNGIKNPRDIFLYSWKQLEQVVDQFPVKSKEHVQRHADNADLIYQKGELEIYKADTKEKCIYYGQQHFGRQYSFCISRPKDGNMYDDYRLEGRTFYFVKMFDAGSVLAQGQPIEDTHHLYVIHATPDPYEFYVTNVDNDGDIRMDWDDIEEQIPELTGLHRLFKFIPFSEDETKEYRIKQWHPSRFAYLNGIEQEQFIESPYLLVFPRTWRSDMPFSWQKRYIEVRKDLSVMFAVENPQGVRKLGRDEVLAYTAFDVISDESDELAKLAYKLTAEIAKSGQDKDHWIYAENALLSIYANYSDRIPKAGGGYVDATIYAIDMISFDQALSLKRLIYYPEANRIEDTESGDEFAIHNNKVVQTK